MLVSRALEVSRDIADLSAIVENGLVIMDGNLISTECRNTSVEAQYFNSNKQNCHTLLERLSRS
jgi:hypothetical protein